MTKQGASLCYRAFLGLKDSVGGLFSKYCEQIEPAAKLQGKVAIVTGATAGIGLETARALAWRGAHVILAGRAPDRLTSANQNIRNGKPKQDNLSIQSSNDLKLSEMIIDLANLSSVRDFADSFLKLNLPLHYLVNNAGVMLCPLSMITVDGFDLQMGSNHLGHFYLTKLLTNKLKESGTARIVAVSSYAHFMGDLNVDGIKKHFYTIPDGTSMQAYNNSKLCNVLHAKELARRFQGTQVTAYSLHPGVVVTEIGRHVSITRLLTALWGWALKNSNQGASTTLYCCLTPGLESENGNYFTDCAVTPSNPQSYDPKLAAALWDASDYYIKQFEGGQLKNKKAD